MEEAVAIRPRAGWVALLTLSGLMSAGLAPHATAAEAASHSGTGADAMIEQLLAKMTIEEKLGQLTQYSGQWAVTGPALKQGGEEQIRSGQVGSFLNVFGADATRKYQRIAVEESRLRIPLLFGHDVIHGFRTIFPVPLAESCSWDIHTVERSARIAAIEASAAGLHWTFAPMVDIARDARWGRVVEGAGEDTFLGSVLATARVRGFQGNDLTAPDTVMACAKHFAAYGGAEAGRDYNTVDISDRTLWETYLPPFKAAVDAGVGSFMTAFNEIGGVPSTSSHYLLSEVLRDQWGFTGIVVSDYTAVMELTHHGVAGTSAEAAALALQAGTDIDMVSGFYMNDLPPLVRDGRFPMKVLDESVRRVLRAKARLGLFDDPYRGADPERERALLLAREHRAAARAIARDSIVLLKNEGGALPLARAVSRLAVIGPLADDRRTVLGSWAGAGRAEEAVSILEGIRAAVSPQTQVQHAKGCTLSGDDLGGLAEAVQLARDSDAVVLVLGEDHDMSGEAASRTSIDLPGVQDKLAEAIKGTGRPVVVVLTNGRPLAIEWLDQNMPAILECWQLGTEMGNAVADVLFGDHNPGGKLTTTFPRRTGQVPLYYNHKNTGRPPSHTDKYTSKYLDTPWTPLYAFGHGLSYTSFKYGELALSRESITPEESIEVRVAVTNTGKRAGVETVQLYVQDEVASVTRPVKELRGFERVPLEPGERRVVAFKLKPSDLAFYNMKMQRVVEPGAFRVFVGTSSADVLEARFNVHKP